jgi:imidazole glycerol phosphate synthase subunit HisF
VLAIDARRSPRTHRARCDAGRASPKEPRALASGVKWKVYTKGGRHDEGIDAIEWAARGESLRASEILLTLSSIGFPKAQRYASKREKCQATEDWRIASRLGC